MDASVSTPRRLRQSHVGPPWRQLPQGFGSTRVVSHKRAISIQKPPLVDEEAQGKRLKNAEHNQAQPPVRPHHIETFSNFEWCRHCGRTSACAGRSRAQQWSRACVTLASHARKQKKGHLLVFTGAWQCTACHSPSARLSTRRCSRLAQPLPLASHTRKAPPVMLDIQAPPTARGFTVGNDLLRTEHGPVFVAERRAPLHRWFHRSIEAPKRARLEAPPRQGVG